MYGCNTVLIMCINKFIINFHHLINPFLLVWDGVSALTQAECEDNNCVWSPDSQVSEVSIFQQQKFLIMPPRSPGRHIGIDG